jgi:hypothetical protein
MQDFDVTYWFDTRTSSSARASTGACVTERRHDCTREEIVSYVEANVERETFLVDLGGDEGCPSLALVRSDAVRYVHIEAVGVPDPRPVFKVDGEDADPAPINPATPAA